MKRALQSHRLSPGIGEPMSKRRLPAVPSPRVRPALTRAPLTGRFAEVHQRGMKSLEAGDLIGHREAVLQERLIIDEQSEYVALLKALIARDGSES